MICPICKRNLGWINSKHIQTHSMTTEEYREKYGDGLINRIMSNKSNKTKVKAGLKEAE